MTQFEKVLRCEAGAATILDHDRADPFSRIKIDGEGQSSLARQAHKAVAILPTMNDEPIDRQCR